MIAQAARARTGPWGTNRSTRAFAGTRTSAGCAAGIVATAKTGSTASASRATDTRRSSSRNSDEVVTRTIGRSTSANQAGAGSGGSHAQGPTMVTFPGQSDRGYSNGSAVRDSSSGGTE